MKGLKIIVEEIQRDEELKSEIEKLEKYLEEKYPELQNLEIYLHINGALHIGSIRVKKEHRNQGIGTKVVDEIVKFADANGLVITLQPEPEWGYKRKLIGWYKSHGFVPNRGRKKDYKYSSLWGPTMLRRPKV